MFRIRGRVDPAGVYSETTASMAFSILVRKNSAQYEGFPATDYIENVGVHPDKVDDYMTEENLFQGGKPFVDRFLVAMVEYINGQNQPTRVKGAVGHRLSPARFELLV